MSSNKKLQQSNAIKSTKNNKSRALRNEEHCFFFCFSVDDIREVEQNENFVGNYYYPCCENVLFS